MGNGMSTSVRPTPRAGDPGVHSIHLRSTGLSLRLVIWDLIFVKSIPIKAAMSNR